MLEHDDFFPVFVPWTLKGTDRGSRSGPDSPLPLVKVPVREFVGLYKSPTGSSDFLRGLIRGLAIFKDLAPWLREL